MIGDDKDGVQPWMQVPKGPVRDLIFAYESILTEMRTWANSDVRIIAEWVRRIDYERDAFVAATEQGDKEFEHLPGCAGAANMAKPRSQQLIGPMCDCNSRRRAAKNLTDWMESEEGQAALRKIATEQGESDE